MHSFYSFFNIDQHHLKHIIIIIERAKFAYKSNFDAPLMFVVFFRNPFLILSSNQTKVTTNHWIIFDGEMINSDVHHLHQLKMLILHLNQKQAVHQQVDERRLDRRQQRRVVHRRQVVSVQCDTIYRIVGRVFLHLNNQNVLFVSKVYREFDMLLNVQVMYCWNFYNTCI
jgi:hypothetical protein